MLWSDHKWLLRMLKAECEIKVRGRQVFLKRRDKQNEFLASEPCATCRVRRRHK